MSKRSPLKKKNIQKASKETKERKNHTKILFIVLSRLIARFSKLRKLQAKKRHVEMGRLRK
jgi:hypothetical protein